MDTQKSKNNISTPLMTAGTITKVSSDNFHPRQRIVQNFLLMWVDASIDESNEDCQHTLTQLRTVVNNVNIFTQQDKAIDFLTDVGDIRVFMIVEGTLAQQIIPLIHDIPQLHTIYIVRADKPGNEQWLKVWIKVKGVYIGIASIRECLQQDVKQCDQDSISVSFVAMDEGASDQSSNQLEPSFMYTQILKDILLGMEYGQQSIKDFVTYCRRNNYGTATNITLFENEYHAHSPIWWYTFPSFIYSMLNNALRLLEADTIINIGFFIYDLHHHIKELHKKQFSSYGEESFMVYRGQSLATTDFVKLLKTKGGLMSFNNFLSTSKHREISVEYARLALTRTDTVGILFKMTIDPSVSSTPFASIQEVSYFHTEEEILFSMHTVFRIGEIIQIDRNNPLYEVKLTLTSDDDQELRTLTKHIQESARGTGWKRLGSLLLDMKQLEKAEEIYTLLLEQTSDESNKASYYNQLGVVKNDQGDYEKAIWYYKRGLEICQKTLPLNHPHLATSYNNIGLVYKNMGEYSKALSLYEKAREIDEKTLPANHPSLATSYNNIASVYYDMGEYSRALSFYEKALEIYQKTLPENHPSLATSYNNIGSVYTNMGEYSKALSFYEKALEIRQKTLPANHPDLATSYNNIGSVYTNMGEYSKALSFYEKALEIRQKTLPQNHPDLATSYNSIASVYYDMGDYVKALSFYEKALEIRQRTLPSNHPDLATSYNNIGSVYTNMEEYSKALSFYEKALEIRQKTLPQNHPDLATFYNSIALVYYGMGEYSKALSIYEKALKIREETLPSNHPSLATSYNNIGSVYTNMGEYSKALSIYEKALEIYQKTLPANHPSLAISYNNIGELYRNMKQYSKALSYYEQALDILQRSLPSNHPHLQSVRKSTEIVKRKL